MMRTSESAVVLVEIATTREARNAVSHLEFRARLGVDNDAREIGAGGGTWLEKIAVDVLPVGRVERRCVHLDEEVVVRGERDVLELPAGLIGGDDESLVS